MKMTSPSSTALSFSFLIAATAVLFFTGCGQQNDSSPEEGTLSINGTEIFYKTMGAGEPIVIIHGGPVLEHSYLLPHLKPLAGNYKLVFFDQRLSGRSSAKVDTADVTMRNFVDDIEALRNELDLGKVHVLGHSWGGQLAMRYAINYPEQTQKLVLSNSMPPSAALWQKEQIELAGRTTKADRQARQKILSSDEFRNNSPAAIEKLLLLSFQNQFHDSTYVDSLDLYIPDDYSTRSGTFGLLMPELQSYDLLPGLADLQIPTLIIYGTDEPAVDLSGKLLKETIPNSELVIIKESGHFPFIEQPKMFLSAVREFLK